MAIQSRRGAFGDFDPNKMLPGEWASVLKDDPKAQDGKSVYMCFAAGDVKRMATYEDMKENIKEATDDVVQEVTEKYTDEIKAATKAANDAAKNVKNDFYGAYADFPETGEENKMYIDTSSNPNKIYTWDSASASYKLVSGAGSDEGTDLSIIGEGFNANKSYAIGDYCVNESSLWEFKAAKGTGAWDSSKVTKRSVIGLIQSLQSRVSKLETQVSSLNARIANITPDDAAVDGKPWTSKHIVDMLCPPLKVSGNPVQCYPVAGYPLGITASWEPAQEGTGDPSPDNIRPILGKTDINIIAAKHNLFREINPIVTGENRSIEILTKEETLALASVLRGRKVSISWKLKTDNVALKEDSESGPKRIGIEAALKRKDGSIFYSIGAWIFKDNIPKSGTVIVSKNVRFEDTANYISGDLNFYVQGLKSGTVEASEFAIYLNEDPAKEFDGIYSHATTLTLPETIYGGSVDAVSGEGEEKWGLLTLTGEESWVEYKNSNYNGYAARLLQAPYGCNTERICSHYKKTELFVGADNELVYFLNVANDADKSTVSLWKKWLADQYAAGTPVQIAYKLNAPISFLATGNAPVKALSGINTVLTDADSVEVTGREDLIHAITGQ